MEFDELKKVWDEQNKEPLYVFNEKALQRKIRKKRNRAQRGSNVSEIGLILIALVTGLPQLIKHINAGDPFYFMLPAIALLLTAVYVIVGSFFRKKKERQFYRSVLGDLDHAIANTQFEINRARTFVWWYITPVAVAIYIKLWLNESPWGTWLFVTGAFMLSFFVVRLGLTWKQIPKKRELERLREKLTAEAEETIAI
ncbi:MAG: hypothetical protein AAFX87_14995 [Bacteroidota bacterium]